MSQTSSNRPKKPFVLWFTGLPCSGKSTLAEEVFARLQALSLSVEHLDGDVVRNILPAKGFSEEERNNHVRQMGFIASRLEFHGVGVIASFVSPYRSSREDVRTLCENLIEVYISTPVEECERRDVKGMYKKAREGEIKNFTGLDDPYEPPLSPELSIDTTNREIPDCLDEILEYLLSNSFIEEK